MSLTSRLGLEGEAGTRDFINMWFPYADQGIGAKIVTSQGSNDIGDIDGVPYTCIECKNHSNPVLGPLMDNAKWKAGNAGRPIWFLSYKRRGYGRRNAKHWHTCTTVEGFLNAVLPTITDDDGETRPAFTLDDVEELCENWEDIDCDVSAEYPGHPQPKLKWTVRVMFRPYKRGVLERRDEDIYSVDLSDTESRVLPMVVHPRIGHDVSDWYVSSRLAAQLRLLETIGVVPQDLDDYISESDAVTAEPNPSESLDVEGVQETV